MNCVVVIIEPEHVENFTVIVVNETSVQLFWIADGRAKQYTVFRRHRSKVCVAVGLQLMQTLNKFTLFCFNSSINPLLWIYFLTIFRFCKTHS